MKKVLLVLMVVGIFMSGCASRQPEPVSGAVAYMDDKGVVHYKEF